MPFDRKGHALSSDSVFEIQSKLPFNTKLMFQFAATRADRNLFSVSTLALTLLLSPSVVLPVKIIIPWGLGCGHLQQTKIMSALHTGIWL